MERKLCGSALTPVRQKLHIAGAGDDVVPAAIGKGGFLLSRPIAQGPYDA
jgi:hypothetical protein